MNCTVDLQILVDHLKCITKHRKQLNLKKNPQKCLLLTNASSLEDEENERKLQISGTF